MCRMYAFIANRPTRVECTLVHAQNALLRQSRSDSVGERHPDGWGIASYDDGVPRVERRATAAFDDLEFGRAAERLLAKTVVAHVRQATVGGPSLVNTHPFTHGRWVFAHNGTVHGFAQVGPRLEAEIAPELRAARHGTTDSETVFVWLLSRMAAAGLDPAGPCGDLAALVELMEDSVRRLDGLSRESGAAEPARLNFFFTDGRILVATRWRKGLYWLRREGLHACEVCGRTHVTGDADGDYRAVVVASEPISEEHWREVPEASVLSVDAELRVAFRTIGVPAPAGS